ncbi:regulator-G-protein signaling domain-containing protein [Schizosaccharomyces japonicus yFS275]|uniref:Regulator-G-protein signaling domain-containing protein n=1 Tax=Schizosaccharomyces japonicus (strain yFS275 / FY16936) TaxID=402676 RepID=B6JWG9_SCHJY|nr:regulator-G-protein signaling domain-containing protein [Schizosaccharomyces japonicus yFS275]EEB05720.1 regulator-G-protein signaling domain-containing protein [Schizosaccharomyces japonicus yFS275]
MSDQIPSLLDILTKPCERPLDLYNYYIYMIENENRVDYLDLWLDIMQHAIVCRQYVKSLRDSTGQMLEPGAERNYLQDGQDRIYAVLYEGNNLNNNIDRFAAHYGPFNFDDLSARDSVASSARKMIHLRASYLSSLSSCREQATKAYENAIQRNNVRALSERILYSYLIEGSEREISIPPQLAGAVATAIEVDQRDDPEIFQSIKDYVYEHHLKPTYHSFVRNRLHKNITPFSSSLRFILGYLATFAGCWYGFCGIFLGYSIRRRVWSLIPFFVGYYFLMAAWKQLDPVLGILGYTETSNYRCARIMNMTVKHSIFRRSTRLLIVVLVLIAATTAIFSCVPSRHL